MAEVEEPAAPPELHRSSERTLLLTSPEGNVVPQELLSHPLRAEALELLSQSIVAYESLVHNLAMAQASGDAASSQLEAAADAAASSSQSAPAIESSALARARQGNAMTHATNAMKAQLEEAQASAAEARQELEKERTLRKEAEAKFEQLKAALASSQGIGSPTMSTEPLRPEMVRVESGSPPSLSHSPSVEEQLARMQIDLQQQLGQPKTAGQFVQSAVAGALAGTASNAVKLLNQMVPPRSPVTPTSEPSSPSP